LQSLHQTVEEGDSVIKYVHFNEYQSHF